MSGPRDRYQSRPPRSSRDFAAEKRRRAAQLDFQDWCWQQIWSQLAPIALSGGAVTPRGSGFVRELYSAYLEAESIGLLRADGRPLPRRSVR
jgi:hypothetical protein